MLTFVRSFFAHPNPLPSANQSLAMENPESTIYKWFSQFKKKTTLW